MPFRKIMILPNNDQLPSRPPPQINNQPPSLPLPPSNALQLPVNNLAHMQNAAPTQNLHPSQALVQNQQLLPIVPPQPHQDTPVMNNVAARSQEPSLSDPPILPDLPAPLTTEQNTPGQSASNLTAARQVPTLPHIPNLVSISTNASMSSSASNVARRS